MPATNPEIALRKRLEQRVRTSMLDRNLWPDGGQLLVAVSGGADSTALLLILSRLAKYRRVPLHVAYFDHALRSQESTARDVAFVGALSKSLAVPFSTGRGEVKVRARTDRTSIEDAARRERYDFLARTARQIGATYVATGHTASDQAETVLLHIIRGAGLDGLAGMSASSKWPISADDDLTLVRPLLRLTRKETYSYCAAVDVDPIEDESNFSPDFARNRVRHELLPLLRSFNPKIEDALVRLAQAASDGAAPSKVRDGLSAVAGGTEGFTASHVQSIERLMQLGSTGDQVVLPKSLRARRTRVGVVIEVPQPRIALPDGEVCLTPWTEAAFGHLLIHVGAAPAEYASHAVEVDADAAASLHVRRRHNGDRMQPAGMEGTKKLQDLFVDAHVERIERDRVPIFENDRGIVWVGGLRIADWAKPQPGRPTVWLSYRDA